MKTTNKLLLAAAVAVSLTFANRAVAGEPLLSPRAKDNQIKIVSGVTGEKLERGLLPGSPKGRDQAASVRKVSGTNADSIDRSLVLTSPKARDVFGPRIVKFQVAPAK